MFFVRAVRYSGNFRDNLIVTYIGLDVRFSWRLMFIPVGMIFFNRLPLRGGGGLLFFNRLLVIPSRDGSGPRNPGAPSMNV